jgi:hypothetical protein
MPTSPHPHTVKWTLVAPAVLVAGVWIASERW